MRKAEKMHPALLKAATRNHSYQSAALAWRPRPDGTCGLLCWVRISNEKGTTEAALRDCRSSRRCHQVGSPVPLVSDLALVFPVWVWKLKSWFREPYRST